MNQSRICEAFKPKGTASADFNAPRLQTGLGVWND
jgi:hypothetical protein